MVEAPSANGKAAARPLLAAVHLADLRGSGLSDEQIAACGFYTAFPVDAQRLLGWENPPKKHGPFLAIPFFAADGTPLDYVRLKPAKPRVKGGKAVKYESPMGKPNRVYLPPATRAALADPAVPLLVTEGEKKAAKADQEGFPCIGLVGVWGWQQARGKDLPDAPRKLLPDLAGVSWQGRAVYIVYDSDLADKKEVAYAEWYFAETLTAAGAMVRVVRLPPGPANAKCGLDDFLILNGPDGLRRLLDTASPPARPAGASAPSDEQVAPDEDDDDPHRLARIFRAASRVNVGAGNADWQDALLYWREEFLRWEDGAYRPLADKEVRAELTTCIKREFDRLWRIKDRRRREKLAAKAAGGESGDDDSKDKPLPPVEKVTVPLTRNVVQALGAVCIVPSAVETPSWLGNEPPLWPPDEIVAGRNGILHLPSLVSGKDCLEPPTPRLFTRNALDNDLALDAPAPRQWLTFLAALWPNDAAAVAALQEWFGYCLLPDTSQQKILMIVGPKRSGKGTIARVLARLVGLANVCAPTLAGLGTNFGLWPLLGKTLAIISDARLSGRTDAAVVVERLLSISGEDGQTIDRKNLSQVTCKLPVRFAILTNELPRLNDASGALVGRLILLRQTFSWYGKEDVSLTAKLSAELPGILLWAAEGWRRLHERGSFQQPESAAQLVQSMEDLNSPIGAFLREKREVGSGHQVAVKDLFAGWRAWCDDKGRKDLMTEQTFGRDLLAVLPQLDMRRLRVADGRVRVYEGVRLAPWGAESDPI